MTATTFTPVQRTADCLSLAQEQGREGGRVDRELIEMARADVAEAVALIEELCVERPEMRADKLVKLAPLHLAILDDLLESGDLDAALLAQRSLALTARAGLL